MIPMIPTPDTIPTSWGYFQFFLMLTFPLHLFFMNSLLGSSAIAIYSHFKGTDESITLAYELAKVIPLLIALAVNFGVAPLLFVQVLYGHLFYTSTILMGVFWILIVPMLLIAYYAAYWYDFKFNRLGRAGIWVISFALLLFLIIGFLFSNNMTLMLHPESWGAYLENSDGTHLNTGDITLWPRYLHFMIGGIAIGGIFVAIYGRFLTLKGQVIGEYATTVGMKMFFWLTLLQVAVGIWFLLALPKEMMLLFMGQNSLATATFIVALLLIVIVLVCAFKLKVFVSSVIASILIFCMVFMRDFLREGYLRETFSPDMLQVVAEYSPMVFFLATLLVGLALIFWMVRAAFTHCLEK